MSIEDLWIVASRAMLAAEKAKPASEQARLARVCYRALKDLREAGDSVGMSRWANQSRPDTVSSGPLPSLFIP